MATPTKAQESIETLKNVNKHLADVLKRIAEKDSALNSVADDLRRLAAKSGEIMVEAWKINKYEPISLKAHLNELATKLEGAKS